MIRHTGVCEGAARAERNKVCGCLDWYCCQEVTPDKVSIAQDLFMRFCAVRPVHWSYLSLLPSSMHTCGPIRSPASLQYLRALLTTPSPGAQAGGGGQALTNPHSRKHPAFLCRTPGEPGGGGRFEARSEHIVVLFLWL